MNSEHVRDHSRTQLEYPYTIVQGTGIAEHFEKGRTVYDSSLARSCTPSSTKRPPKESDTITDSWANLKLINGGLQIYTGPDNGSPDDAQGPDTHRSWRMHDRNHVDYIVERINHALADPGSMLCVDAEQEDSRPDPFLQPVQSKTTREFLRSFMTGAPDAGGVTGTSYDSLGDGEDAASVVRAIREREHVGYNDD